MAAQQEEFRSIHHDCAELQRKSATTKAELQRKSAHEEHALYQHFDECDPGEGRPGPRLAARAFAHARKATDSAGSRSAVVALLRIAASTSVFADGPSTVRFATPVEKVSHSHGFPFTRHVVGRVCW